MVVEPVAFIVAWSPVLGAVSLGLVSVSLDDTIVASVFIVSTSSFVDAQLTRAIQRIERAMKGVRFMMFLSPPVTRQLAISKLKPTPPLSTAFACRNTRWNRSGSSSPRTARECGACKAGAIARRSDSPLE